MAEKALIKHLAENANDRSALNDTQEIKVILCGTGAPQPKSVSGQACTVVVAGGMALVFDAGENAFRSISQSGIPLASINSVFITHWHSDHFNGLGGLINQSWLEGRNEPLKVYGPAGVDEIVHDLSSAYMLDEEFRQGFIANPQFALAKPVLIDISASKNNVRVFSEQGITVDAVLVKHFPVEPALGYVVRYRGKKIFISGDTSVSPIYEDAMKDADLVVHEALNSHLINLAAQTLNEMGRRDQAKLASDMLTCHADTLEIAKMAERTHVKHLVLTHLIPNPPNILARHVFAQGMSDYFHGKLDVGSDGSEYEIALDSPHP